MPAVRESVPEKSGSAPSPSGHWSLRKFNWSVGNGLRAVPFGRLSLDNFGTARRPFPTENRLLTTCVDTNATWERAGVRAKTRYSHASALTLTLSQRERGL